LSFKRQSDRGQQWQQFQQHLPGQSAAVTAQLDGDDSKGHGIWDMGYGTWYMDMDMDCAGNASHSRPVDSTLRAIVYLCVWHLHYPICLSINSSPRWGVEMPNCCFHFATNLRNYISSRNICMYAGDPGARFLNSFLGGSSFQLYGQTWASFWPKEAYQLPMHSRLSKANDVQICVNRTQMAENWERTMRRMRNI